MAPLTDTEKLLELMRLAGVCQECPRCQSRSYPVFGHGVANAEVVVIVPEPDRADDETVRYMTSPKWEPHRAGMKRVGFDKIPSFITGATICVRKEALNDEVIVSAYDFAKCQARLVQTLRIIQPKIVIMVGNKVPELLFEIPNPCFPWTSQGVTFWRITYPEPGTRDQILKEWEIVGSYLTRLKDTERAEWMFSFPIRAAVSKTIKPRYTKD